MSDYGNRNSYSNRYSSSSRSSRGDDTGRIRDINRGSERYSRSQSSRYSAARVQEGRSSRRSANEEPRSRRSVSSEGRASRRSARRSSDSASGSSRRYGHADSTPRSYSMDADDLEARNSRYDNARVRDYGNFEDDKSRYYNSSDRSKYSSKARKGKKASKLKIAIIAIVAVLLLGAGLAFGALSTVTKALQNGVDMETAKVLVDSDINNEPFYMLLMGTDASSDRESDEYFGGVFRTDTIMVARIDPVEKTVTLISIPRDTMVDLGEYGTQKINAAHAYGGSALAVQAVSDLTGLPISHYAEINFDGFCSIVDTLGGIEVDVPIEINDSDAGGHLDAGLQTLTGDQALILCRSRNAYEELGAGGGDYYRSANQRLVIGAIAKKLLNSDIFTITSSVGTLANYVTTDLNATQIISLFQHFRDFDISTSFYTCQYPTTTQMIGGVSYEVTNKTEWKTMKERMEQGLPPTTEDEVDPLTGTVMATAGDSSSSSSSSESTSGSSSHSGTVLVRNGTSTTGLADKAASVLQGMGFTTNTGNSNTQLSTTLVVYEQSSDASEASQIVSALGCGTTALNDGSYLNDGKFLVILGTDYANK